MADETMIRYLGDGSAYVEGVPARDLTRDEWDRIRPALKALAIATGLYDVPAELSASQDGAPQNDAAPEA